MAKSGLGWTVNDEYYMEEVGTIAIVNGRTFSKTVAGPCIVINACPGNGGYSGPIVLSTEQSYAQYDQGNTHSTLVCNYLGMRWYMTEFNYWFSGTVSSTGGKAIDVNLSGKVDWNNREKVALYILSEVVNVKKTIPEYDIVTRKYLSDIADAIRQKSGGAIADETKYTEYLNTNYSGFMVTFSNWTYNLSDKFEFVYKMNTSPATKGQWCRILDCLSSIHDLHIGFNLWNNRKVMNFWYNNSYTGDGAVTYETPYDYDNFYKIVVDKGAFTIYKGATIDDISTVCATWSATSASGDVGNLTLFDTTDGTLDLNFYYLKAWDSTDNLIHEYKTVTTGLYDTVDDEYFTSDADFINGPEGEYVHPQSEVKHYYPSEMARAILAIPTGGGGGAQILHNEYKSSTTGDMNLTASINIPSTGSYIINAGGYVDTLTVKINNVSQPLTYERSLHFVRFYLETKTLNAGDVLDIAAVGSGNTCALISVIKE